MSADRPACCVRNANGSHRYGSSILVNGMRGPRRRASPVRLSLNDILGGDIKLDRGPLSRVTGLGTGDPVYRLLARLNEKDLWLPDPSSGVRIVKLSDGTRRKMTDTEKDRFQRLTGQMYRDFLTEHGQRLLQTEQEAAKKEISRITDHLRERAAYQATH